MHKTVRFLLKGLALVLGIGVLVYIALLLSLFWKINHLPPQEGYEAIIVLGAQVKRDGTPNVQLQWRLDAAAEAWQEHPCPVVVCGAQGADEPRAEALVMRDYLVDHGLPSEQVLTDPASFNTRQNLQNAAALLSQAAPAKVLVVTSDYHLPRALALAGDVGLTATGIGSPTLGGWYRVKNFARETVAWAKLYVERLLGIEIQY